MDKKKFVTLSYDKSEKVAIKECGKSREMKTVRNSNESSKKLHVKANVNSK
jgi:hypothetical protein